MHWIPERDERCGCPHVREGEIRDRGGIRWVAADRDRDRWRSGQWLQHKAAPLALNRELYRKPFPPRQAGEVRVQAVQYPVRSDGPPAAVLECGSASQRLEQGGRKDRDVAEPSVRLLTGERREKHGSIARAEAALLHATGEDGITDAAVHDGLGNDRRRIAARIDEIALPAGPAAVHPEVQAVDVEDVGQQGPSARREILQQQPIVDAGRHAMPAEVEERDVAFVLVHLLRPPIDGWADVALVGRVDSG